MKQDDNVKTVSYFMKHADDVFKEVTNQKKTLFISEHGETKAVIQDIHSYEQLQESIAMLKLLALSNKNLNEENYKPIHRAFEEIRARIDQEK